MAEDFSAWPIDTNTSFAAAGAFMGTKLLLPQLCRVVEISSEDVLRISISEDDAVTLSAANSNIYQASVTADVWPRGVTPGGEAESSYVDGPQITVGRATAGVVSLVFRK
jgi:hypothetical protein